MVLSVVPVVLLLFSFPAESSRGDRSRDFQSCVVRCSRENCSDVHLPFSLRLLAWSCPEECQYQCMHTVTAEDVRLGRPIRQFYGKWPFVRLLGIQEPASTLFSLLNALSNIHGYTQFKKEAPLEYPYHTFVSLQFWVSVHTWFWSAVFHSRDTYWTEKLDYFSAASFIVSGLILQFVRLTGPSAVGWHSIYAIAWVGLYVAHVSYLTFVKFDYGYNMAASVSTGTLYACVWVLWCLKHRERRRYAWKCIAVVLGTTLFVSLELLDFPPLWWLLDAHSLWHLSTIPLPLLWYSFLTDDANYEVQMLKKYV